MVKKNAGKRKSDPAKAISQPVPGFFERLGKKAPLLLLMLLTTISIIIFRDYLFQDKYYLFKTIGSDSLNGMYPYYYCVADYLTHHAAPGWSFKFGMGHSLFPFVLQDPFSIFLYAAGKDHIMSVMVYKEMAKVTGAGMMFFYYLRLLKVSDFTAIIGGLLYAYCGFMIVGSCWYLFSFEAFNMALLLLAFELLFTRGKWYLFPLPVFLFCISQPFNLYLYGLFLALYAVLRLFHTGTFSVRALGALFLKMALFGLVGVILSGPFLLENVYQLLMSPRGSGATSYAHELRSQSLFTTPGLYQVGTCLLRFFSSDMAGTGQYYDGAYNYLEAPEYYCGIVCLLLMPQVFGLLNKKARIAFAVFAAIWLAGLFFPYVRYAFWLFSGDYFRAYSFFGSLCFLIYSLLALDMILKQKKINKWVLLASIAVLFFVLAYPWFPPKEELLFPDQLDLIHPLFVLAGIAVAAYAAILFFMTRVARTTPLKFLFLALVIGEVAFLSHRTVNNMDALETSIPDKNIGYDDYQQDAVNYLKQADYSFFRIDKGCFSAPTRLFSFNDAMVQGYDGTCSYNSFNQLYYVFYMQLVGIADSTSERNSRWAIGVLHRPLLETVNSVKYVLAQRGRFFLPFWNFAYDSIARYGDIKVLRNKFALPLGFTYQKYIRQSVFSKLSWEQKDMVSLRACAVKDEDASKAASLKEFDLRDTVIANSFNREDHYTEDTGAKDKFNTEIYRAYVNELATDTMTSVVCDDNRVSGKISVRENKMMYLSIPYDKGWRLRVDGKPTDKIILSAGMTGVLLTPGTHTIEMDFEPPFLRVGLLMSLLGIAVYGGLFAYRKKIKLTRV